MKTDELGELLVEREWRKCGPDWDTSTNDELVDAFVYWCTKYVKIRFPGKGKIAFELREAQLETVRKWIEHRFTITLKARQVGFSTLVSLFSFWLTFFYRDRVVLMISSTQRDSEKLLRHARYAYRFLPDWMKMRGPLADITLSAIKFSNESIIESLPSASDPARGETAFLIIVDEMGQLPNSEDAWASIEPVADLGGRICMLGTARGEGNLFHKLWVQAEAGKNRFTPNFHSWRAVSTRDDAWYAKQKAELPEWQLAQEYPDNPDEAFLKSGRPVFDMGKLRAIVPREPVRGFVTPTVEGGFQFDEDTRGPLRVWSPPVEGHLYSIGVDVAEGLEHGDFSSAHVIDAHSKEVVAAWHGHVDPDLLGEEVCAHLGRWYNNALMVVESNNHGLTTLTALKRIKYIPLFRQRRLGNKNVPQTEALGWRTTVASKPLAIDELNRALREGELLLECADTVQEMRTYVRDDNGRMNGSPHDDRVMSLAIANQGLKWVFLREYRPQEGVVFGSMEWHRQRLANETHSSFSDEEPIGAFAYAG